MAAEKHYPFSCGTQFLDWTGRNCDVCAKASKGCEIEHAIMDAQIGDGSVPESIAERMGYLDHSPPRSDGFHLTWPCKEFEGAEDGA